MSECRKFGFGKFSSMRVSQEFNIEHLYSISNSSYSLLAASNGLNLSREEFTLPKTRWNSGSDYSAENMNRGKAVYSYNKTITQDGLTGTAAEEIKIQSDEFLYGGKDGWFYGIWKGSLDDAPFSGKRLREHESSAEGISSEEDFSSRKNSVPAEISGKQKEQKAADSVHFYLPQRQDECELARNASGFRNASVPYSVDYPESLMGTVAMYSEARKTSAGRELSTSYYMPFVFGNIIHADRAGGVSYYKIEGLTDNSESTAAQPAGSSLLSMPAIRKSYTEATDKTPSAKFGIGPVGADLSRASSSSSAKDSYNLAVSLPGGSASVGENSSISAASQILQDVNADGIPDIVQAVGGALRIIEGARLNESGEIGFSKERTVPGIPFLSKKRDYVKGVRRPGLGAGLCEAGPQNDLIRKHKICCRGAAGVPECVGRAHILRKLQPADARARGHKRRRNPGLLQREFLRAGQRLGVFYGLCRLRSRKHLGEQVAVHRNEFQRRTRSRGGLGGPAGREEPQDRRERDRRNNL